MVMRSHPHSVRCFNRFPRPSQSHFTSSSDTFDLSTKPEAFGLSRRHPVEAVSVPGPAPYSPERVSESA
ncbi:hypothetical protein SCLCIDRAFT_1213410 [Scleroderma citrinum Foug A]|uniref:Uncharacterized protein n=1 Tax=Scleroderma citrinum Foug A TaxID=1036808 RepID=A0A0C3E798_9AGAM|nr:hypothetical protein SCLCIDRAFT_1213410 [Scleroderma citrinum Foug A]